MRRGCRGYAHINFMALGTSRVRPYVTCARGESPSEIGPQPQLCSNCAKSSRNLPIETNDPHLPMNCLPTCTSNFHLAHPKSHRFQPSHRAMATAKAAIATNSVTASSGATVKSCTNANSTLRVHACLRTRVEYVNKSENEDREVIRELHEGRGKDGDLT